METLELRPRNKAAILNDAIKGGIVGGLNKCYKWDLISRRDIIDEEEIVSVLSNYVFVNIDEEFDLDLED